jgi:AraC family transcriptional regulator
MAGNADLFGKRFGSFRSFYEHAYGQHIAHSHTFGGVGASLVVADQSPGDWSDAPTPDLLVSRLATAPTGITCDIGGGRGRHMMVPRSFIVVPPDFATTIVMDEAHRAEVVAIPFAKLTALLGDHGSDALPADGDFGPLHCGVWSDEAVGRVVDALFDEARSGNPHGALGADGLVLQLVGRLVSLRNNPPRTASRGGLARWQERLVCAFLEDNLGRDVALVELARLVDLSPSHFSRAFARSTGRPPHRYLLERRIERAKDMLATGELSITDIALACGFSTSQHFAATFRAKVGVRPSQWRKDRRASR